MKLFVKQTAYVILSCLLFFVLSSAVMATGDLAVGPAEKSFNMAIVYGITSATALLLAIGYWSFLKKKEFQCTVL